MQVKNNADDPLRPGYATEGTEDVKAEDLLKEADINLAGYDSSDFKFGSAGQYMTFRVSVKAGQTITINAQGKTASSNKTDNVVTSYKTSTVTCTVNDGDPTTWSFAGTMGDDGETPTAPYSDAETVTYTATEDGVVVIKLDRGSNTGKIKQITITVADPTPAE